jgi:hypothetical protein
VIKDIIDKLDEKDKSRLMYAFENDFSQEVTLDDGTFIGVNIYATDSIEVIEEINRWLHGRRK